MWYLLHLSDLRHRILIYLLDFWELFTPLGTTIMLLEDAFMPCTNFLLLRRPRGTQFGNHWYASFSIGANLVGENSWSGGGYVVKLWDIRCVVSLFWWATCIWSFGDRQCLLKTETGLYSQSAYECSGNLIRFTGKLRRLFSLEILQVVFAGLFVFVTFGTLRIWLQALSVFYLLR